MAYRKLKARGDLFRKAFAAARAAFQRTYRELSRLIEELRLSAVSAFTQLGIETFGLADGRSVQVFTGAAGIVLFYSDGNSFFALKPLSLLN